MSRDLHIHCEAHGDTSDALGHADRVLVVSRRFVKDRKELLELMVQANDVFQMEIYEIFDRSLRNAMWFFRKHPECTLGLVDEYGKHYDLSAEPTECYAVLKVTDRRESYISMCDYFEVDFEFPCQRDQADGHQNHIHESTDSRGVEFKITWNAWKGKDD